MDRQSRKIFIDQSPPNLSGLKDTLELGGLQVDLIDEEKGWISIPAVSDTGLVLVESAKLARLMAENRKLVEENQRLSKLADAKGQFIRLVTHELKSPIAAVENYLKLILQGYIGLADQEEVLEKCIVRTCEERQLIDDLLDLGRLDDINLLEKKPVSIDQVLENVLSECQDDVLEKRLTLEINITENIPPLRAVPELMKSIWCNLISNALKYTLDGGKIVVSLTRQGDLILGSVRDTGIGISEEDQKKIFHEFFRADNARKSSYAGTGLGLVLVKNIIEGLGGEIKVSSILGEGTCFDFSVPFEVNQWGD